MRKLLVPVLLLAWLLAPGPSFAQIKEAKEGKYTYQYVENDPLGARIYKLPNGLTVYLSKNTDEPRIQTLIAVKAGSAYDPATATGLAHYLEHMMFKGTDEIGTKDWAKEKVLLDKISDLYEKHRNTQDTEKRKAIYAQIDSLSQVAASYALSNEYDKMVSSLGAKRTNAYTSNDQTVYMNDIPANELERWLYLEQERFSQLVLRLFHTELETVYEEFNRGQDNDGRKVWQAMYSNLFGPHPYGTQTTIGTGEHLKNPSMVFIHDYFNKYYVPSNVAICLAGDLEYTQTMQLIEKHFGNWKGTKPPKVEHVKLQPITKPQVAEVFGPESESVSLSYRIGSASSDDVIYANIVKGILYNNQAGLMDLNLNQKQKVLGAYSFVGTLKDYGFHGFSAKAREGQTLEEVRDLMLAEIEKIKKGEFDQWLIDAVVNNYELNEVKALESNYRRAATFVASFTEEIPYDKMVNEIARMRKVTKQQLVDFANKTYKDNYVIVYKRTGDDPNIAKVEKPHITPLTLNRDDQSPFYASFNEMESSRLEPVFLNFNEDIKRSKLQNGVEVSRIENTSNDLFSLYYILDMGSHHDPKMAMAYSYLSYLGTDKYSPEELRQELFRLGLSMDVFSSDERVYVYVSGLKKSFDEGVKLLEHLLANVKPDQKALDDLVARTLKSRADAKKSKSTILWRAMFSYGEYGEDNPFKYNLSEAELKALKAEELTDKIKATTGYKHKIFYYGSMPEDKVLATLNTYHKVPAKLKDYPAKKKFAQLGNEKPVVYFVDYDMVQAEVLMLSRGDKFNKQITPMSRLFNEYFGSGLSSVVFQEIRESKALAYSAFASYSTPGKADEHHMLYSYVGTQADKIKDAIPAIQQILNDMPESPQQLDNARNSVMRQIETERITKSSIYWNYLSAQEKGLDYDVRQDIYSNMSTANMDQMRIFFNENIKERNYTVLVLGKKSDLDLEYLKSLGTFKELTLEDLFGY